MSLNEKSESGVVAYLRESHVACGDCGGERRPGEGVQVSYIEGVRGAINN